MYTIETYTTISESSDYTLPQKYLDNVSILHKCLGVHNLPVKSMHVDNRRLKNDSANNWKKKEDFKATVMVKKEGCETLIGELKKQLNKMTTANYDTQLGLILENMDLIRHFYDGDEDGEDKSMDGLSQAMVVMLHVACNNKYHSGLYAKLFSHLSTIYPYFLDKKVDIYEKLLSSFDDIEIVDPNEDYDNFCIMNKKNDARRAHMLFVINLFKCEIFTIDQLTVTITKLIDMISQQVNDSNRAEYTNELTEIINVFVTNMISEIKTNNELRFVNEKIIEYSKYKTKDYPGLSSRTIFKYMDMVDMFK